MVDVVVKGILNLSIILNIPSWNSEANSMVNSVGSPLVPCVTGSYCSRRKKFYSGGACNGIPADNYQSMSTNLCFVHT